tara:strand:- start:15027 stop:15635 length:609 start_codon:yes stop_codon:yes gene_type:complete
MNSTKVSLILIISTLFLVNIYLLFVIKSEREVNYIDLQQAQTQQNSLDHEVSFQSKFIKNLYESSLTAKMKDEIRDRYSEFYDQIKLGEKIIIYFNDRVCGSCLLKAFQDLDLVSEKIGKNNILAVTNMRTKNGQVMKSGDYDFQHYYVETFGLSVENYNQPIIFILDEALNMRALYVTELFPDYRFNYFSKTLPNSFEKNN